MRFDLLSIFISFILFNNKDDIIFDWILLILFTINYNYKLQNRTERCITLTIHLLKKGIVIMRRTPTYLRLKNRNIGITLKISKELRIKWNSHHQLRRAKDFLMPKGVSMRSLRWFQRRRNWTKKLFRKSDKWIMR